MPIAQIRELRAQWCSCCPGHTAAQCKPGVESRSGRRQGSVLHCLQETFPGVPNPPHSYHQGSVSSLLVPRQARAALALSELSQGLKRVGVMLICWGLSGLGSPFPSVPSSRPFGDSAGPSALLACSSVAVESALNINGAAPGTAVTSITGLLDEGCGCLSKVKQCPEFSWLKWHPRGPAVRLGEDAANVRRGRSPGVFLPSPLLPWGPAGIPMLA